MVIACKRGTHRSVALGELLRALGPEYTELFHEDRHNWRGKYQSAEDALVSGWLSDLTILTSPQGKSYIETCNCLCW